MIRNNEKLKIIGTHINIEVDIYNLIYHGLSRLRYIVHPFKPLFMYL